MLSPKLARIRSFEVIPALPEALKPLLEIANNIWWSWNPEAVDLFLRIDRELWTKCNHNPVRMLGRCSQAMLDRAARDEGYLTCLQRVVEKMNHHLTRTPWLVKEKIHTGDMTIAYFCAEFGLTESLQIYSGGLGCLAGDHLKSASELGLPLVAVGLLYRNGYFQQYLNADGWQQEYYPELDFANLPVSHVCGEDGKQVKVTVKLIDRTLTIGLWKTLVGRVNLYLLDTNLPENDPADRNITSQLYGGDMEMRIKQEIVLGIGGIRALLAIGINPDVCHMNEGHSAFLALERVRNLIEKYGLTFDEAREYASASHVFTTHTPVPAGIDRFPSEMLQRYFKNYHASLKLDMEGLLALGREDVSNRKENFSMAVLAIRTANWANGVSKLHGHVSRGMWQNIWAGLPQSEVPITHVTNGVHARSWLSGDLIQLFDRYIGSRWQDNPTDQTVWETVEEVPTEELWRVHERRRHNLVVWARRKLREQLEARGVKRSQVQDAVDSLHPSVLTIGFARRFAVYKRANLLFRQPERLLKILTDAKRPVQFIIAGKSHPADGGGKDLIRQIIHFTRKAGVGHRVVFLENYDINVARKMVQGCDVWLNTPRRGMEASGTSGMKAALNGVLNCSIMDGWWDEAYENEIGWQIGRGESHANVEMQDDIEANALYDLLETQIVPIFYDRDEFDIPHEWVTRMKRCIARLAPVFNTNRMVQEYTENLYLPAYKQADLLRQNKLEKSVELAHLKYRLHNAWGHLAVKKVTSNTVRTLGVRDTLELSVTAHLNDLDPKDLLVQAYVGELDNDGQIFNASVTNLTCEKSLGQGDYHYTGSIRVHSSGRYGYAIRMVPGGELFGKSKEPGLIYWESQASDLPEPEPALVGSRAK